MGTGTPLQVEVTLQSERIGDWIAQVIAPDSQPSCCESFHESSHELDEMSDRPQSPIQPPTTQFSTQPPTTQAPTVSQGAIAPELLLTETLWSALFQQWLAELKPQFSPIFRYELSLRLTTDDDIQALNRDYRHIDRPTDVLAFSTLDEVTSMPDSVYSVMPFYLGDIVISVETAQQQAQQQCHSLTTELLWLATHGLLHLLGWDHPDDDRLEEMLAQQQRLVDLLDV